MVKARRVTRRMRRNGRKTRGRKVAMRGGYMCKDVKESTHRHERGKDGLCPICMCELGKERELSPR